MVGSPLSVPRSVAVSGVSLGSWESGGRHTSFSPTAVLDVPTGQLSSWATGDMQTVGCPHISNNDQSENPTQLSASSQLSTTLEHTPPFSQSASVSQGWAQLGSGVVGAQTSSGSVHTSSSEHVSSGPHADPNGSSQPTGILKRGLASAAQRSSLRSQ